MKKFISALFTLTLIMVIMVIVASTYEVIESTSAVVPNPNDVEVETFIMGFEISHMDYAEKLDTSKSTYPNYIMAIRNDEYAAVLNITDEQYASYREDEVVSVEVRIMEDSEGNVYNLYALLD